MLKRLAILALLLSAIAGGMQWLLDLSVAQTAEATSAPRDDGWRHTKQGWVRLSPRIIPAQLLDIDRAAKRPHSSPDSVGDKETVIWGLHPLGLVIFLALGSAAAFCLLPGGESPLARCRSQTLF